MGAKRKGTASAGQGKRAKATAPGSPQPRQSGPRKCRHIKASGSPCRAAPLKDSDFCRIHDPRKEVKAKVAESNRAGGVSKAAKDSLEWNTVEIRTREDLRKVVDQVVDQVASGKMQPKISYALAPHLTLLAKLFEPVADRPPASGQEDVTSLVLEVLGEHPQVRDDMLKRLEMTRP